MSVAALFDIHGNLPALEAVLAEVEALGCERIVVGGDVCLGPNPREVLERLERVGDGVAYVRGNCDRDMATTLRREPDSSPLWDERRRWATEQMRPEQRDMLGGLPLHVRLEVAGLGAVLFCHATPRSDEEIVTRLTPEARLAGPLAGVSEATIVSGHTHVQYDRRVHGRRWINAGSVGMPYEGRPGAYWALLGPTVELRRTSYDFEGAAARIGATGFPRAEDFARELFVTPKTPEQATRFFEQKAEEQARTGG